MAGAETLRKTHPDKFEDFQIQNQPECVIKHNGPIKGAERKTEVRFSKYKASRFWNV